MASLRLLGGSWAARPLRKHFWATLGSVLAALGHALGASLGRLGPPRRSPGGLGRLREWLREAIVAFVGVAAEEIGKKLKHVKFS